MMTRRQLIFGAVALPALAQSRRTNFQVACMTLPYSQFPMQRALDGIRGAGYRYVARGTAHMEAPGDRRPALALDAKPAEAKSLADRCRGMGLTPVMMFSTVQLEAPNAGDAHARRIEQASAAGIPFLLTFGKTQPGEYPAFIANLKRMAPLARAAKITVVIKQHGGNTATGRDCARIVAEVGDEGLKVCYDAGNVLDYEHADAIADIQSCWRDVRAFCIKDHRFFPKSQDCGPGFGEVDHYKLLAAVANTGLDMPLAAENIFEPVVPRPSDPAGVDSLARRAREYVETVIRGLQAS